MVPQREIVKLPVVEVIAYPVMNWVGYASALGGYPTNSDATISKAMADFHKRGLDAMSLFSILLHLTECDSVIRELSFGHIQYVVAQTGVFCNGTLADWKSFLLTNAKEEWTFERRLVADVIYLKFASSDYRIAFSDLFKKQLPDRSFSLGVM